MSIRPFMRISLVARKPVRAGVAVLLSAALLPGALLPGAWAGEAPVPAPQASVEQAPAIPDDPAARAAALDVLFDQLAKARSLEESRPVEAAIFKLWMQSGSPSIDLLMQRGLEAFSEKDFDRALFYFDEVVKLAPDFAEGWDKRAAVYYLKDNYSGALKDIERVLQLEPRHFGALAGLAVILRDLGDKKGALDAFRRALRINPWLDGAAQAEGALEIEVEGRGI